MFRIQHYMFGPCTSDEMQSGCNLSVLKNILPRATLKIRWAFIHQKYVPMRKTMCFKDNKTL